MRFLDCIRAGAVATVTALACAAPPDRPAPTGSERVVAAKPAGFAETQPAALRLQIDPPGALRGRIYRGSLRGEAGGSAFEGPSVRLRALRPEALAGMRVIATSDTALRFECQVTDAAVDTEALFVVLEEAGRKQEISVLLRVVEPPWNPAWRPIAVAPADTAVADSTCEVVLDVRRSRHPAGPGAMHFRWAVDDGSVVIKGGPVTSTRLPPGRHTVVLVAEDAFGYVSRDTMRVHVGRPER